MVEVTQADREAAASVAVLVEMRELILAGRADHHAEPFARHRETGRRAGLEEAAKMCGTLAETTYDDADGFAAATGCEAAIRSKIGGGHSAPAERCISCELPATRTYDGDRVCEQCARDFAQRDFEEGDDTSNLMGG